MLLETTNRTEAGRSFDQLGLALLPVRIACYAISSPTDLTMGCTQSVRFSAFSIQGCCRQRCRKCCFVPHRIAIPIALSRAHFGEKWPKNGEMAIFNPHLGQISHFSTIFPTGAKIHCSAIVSHFGPEARNGVRTACHGNQDLNHRK